MAMAEDAPGGSRDPESRQSGLDERLREAVTQLGHLVGLPAVPAELLRFWSPRPPGATRWRTWAMPRPEGGRPSGPGGGRVPPLAAGRRRQRVLLRLGIGPATGDARACQAAASALRAAEAGGCLILVPRLRELAGVPAGGGDRRAREESPRNVRARSAMLDCAPLAGA